MSPPRRILIADADTVAASALSQTLSAQGLTCAAVYTHDQVLCELDRADADTNNRFGVILIDQDFGRTGGGLELVQRLRNDRPSLVPVVTCAFRKAASAVQAMRLGAADYLLKPLIESELLDAIERAVQRHLLLAEVAPQEEVPAKPNTDPPTPERSSGQTDAGPPHAPVEGWRPMPLAEAMKGPERDILLQALEANGWNRGQTAKQLDINRTTLYKKIRQYRLDEPA